MKTPRIILVEPSGPLNIGSVARVMKNFGFEELILVNAKASISDQNAKNMASHANDLLASSVLCTSLQEALEGCTRVVATTSRVRDASVALESPKQVMSWLLETPQTAALIFGPEDRGLNNEELGWAQRWMSIPASAHYPTLNLAQTVAICCYELFQSQQMPTSSENNEVLQTECSPANPKNEVDLTVLTQLLEHLSQLLQEIGFLLPHTAKDRIGKVRRLLFRASPTLKEFALLRAILAHIEWALHHPEKWNSK
ncbi:RNA methyltransferase [Deltaproteobacteria bacterium TL4]